MTANVSNKTFEFSEEDYSRIMLKDTLFEAGEASPHSSDMSSLLKLQEKETRKFLHAVQLSDYLRAKRIPKGLRMFKIPMVGRDDEEFVSRWCEILNKCSFDLMALTIQHLSKELEATKREVTSLENKLRELPNKEEMEKLLQECERRKAQIAQEVTLTKKKKWERDARHYELGTVYQWTQNNTEQSQQHHGAGKRQQHAGKQYYRQRRNPTTTMSSSELDSGSSTTSLLEPFLEEGQSHHRPPQKHSRRGGRRPGGGYNAGRGEPYHTRQSNLRGK